MNLKKSFSELIYPAITITLIGLWIIGAIHGKKKHDVEPFSSNFFVCWYYGLETMWHKTDYRELNDDVKSAVYIIASKPEMIDAKAEFEFNETKKGFRKVIDKLNKDELSYVKSGANTYVDYIASFQNDMVNACLNFKQTRQLDLSLSTETVTLSKKCSQYGLDNEIAEFQKVLVEIEKSVKEKYSDSSKPLDESIWDEQKIKDDMKQKIERVRSAYREIFNES